MQRDISKESEDFDMADNLMNTIEKLGVVPVIVLKDAEKAVPLAEALLDGGIPCIEVTFRTSAAEESIRRICKAYPQMMCGAGTVLSIEQAKKAIDAGAKFIVSPGLDENLVRWCQEHDIPVFPGVCTASEVQAAVGLGLNVLKFFPAESSGGVKMIKDLCGPFPNVRFMTTGGISMANLAEYAKSPYVVAVGGSWMAKGDMIEKEDWQTITGLCRQAVGAIHDFRNAKGCCCEAKDKPKAEQKPAEKSVHKIVTFGEIMLRLKSPEHERFFQSPLLEATFGGGEANVAVSLSIFGEHAQFVTALPKNAIGEGALSEIRKHGVDVSRINMVDGGRVGIYFLETGADQRPSLVVYDRADSCIAKAKPSDFDFDAIMADADWFHVTGITPAVSQSCADCALAAMKAAKKAGAKVSIDLNYRKKLWKYGKTAPEVMRELTRYADVIIANEEDIQKCLDISAPVDVTSGKIDTDVYKVLTAEVKKQFPNISHVAVSLRESKSADRNGWSAALNGKTGFYHSRHYEMNDIVDRVGGGDSFAAGIIFGLLNYEDEEFALNFAVASSALKHTIPGDFNLTRRSEVEALCKGDGSGRVQR